MITWKKTIGRRFISVLAPGLILEVTMSTQRDIGPRWIVAVFGTRLDGRCVDEDEAKGRAERIAKQILGEAMEKLLGGGK